MDRTKFDKSKVNCGNSVQEKKDNISKQIQSIRHEASETIRQQMQDGIYTLTDYASSLNADLSAMHDIKSGKREFSGTLQALVIMSRKYMQTSPQEFLFGEQWELEIPKILSCFLLKYQKLNDSDKEKIDSLFKSLPCQQEIDAAELSYYRLRELCASKGKLLQGEYTEPYTTAIKTSYMLWIDSKRFMGNYSSFMFFCAVFDMPADYFVCLDYTENPLIYFVNQKKKCVSKGEKAIIKKYLMLSQESQAIIAGEVFSATL